MKSKKMKSKTLKSIGNISIPFKLVSVTKEVEGYGNRHLYRFILELNGNRIPGIKTFAAKSVEDLKKEIYNMLRF
jgi:hypothetical protein